MWHPFGKFNPSEPHTASCTGFFTVIINSPTLHVLHDHSKPIQSGESHKLVYGFWVIPQRPEGEAGGSLTGIYKVITYIYRWWVFISVYHSLDRATLSLFVKGGKPTLKIPEPFHGSKSKPKPNGRFIFKKETVLCIRLSENNHIKKQQ